MIIIPPPPPPPSSTRFLHCPVLTTSTHHRYIHRRPGRQQCTVCAVQLILYPAHRNTACPSLHTTLHPFPTHSHHHYSNLHFYFYSYISRFHLFPPVNHLCPATPSRNHPLPHKKPGLWAHMASGPTTPRQQQRKDKLLIIMGATGAGKSRLSLGLATRFPFFEIVKSDKMQLYARLDITASKLPIPE